MEGLMKEEEFYGRGEPENPTAATGKFLLIVFLEKFIQSFPSPRLMALSNARQPSLLFYLLISKGRRDGFMTFLSLKLNTERFIQN